MSINKAIVIGNLGDNPEIRTTHNGNEIAKLRVATNAHFTDKEGQRQKHTEWHNVVIFSQRLVDKVVKPHLEKGKEIYIEGALRTDSYTKDGETRQWKDNTHETYLQIDAEAQIAIMHDIERGNVVDSRVVFWNTYNSNPLPDVDESTLNFERLPTEFRRYFD